MLYNIKLSGLQVNYFVTGYSKDLPHRSYYIQSDCLDHNVQSTLNAVLCSFADEVCT